MIDYTDYIIQNLNKTISYSEYIAEHLYQYTPNKNYLKIQRKKKLERLNTISEKSEKRKFRMWRKK